MIITFNSVCDNPTRYERQIANQSFAKENVFEKYLDSCFFNAINFIDCSFLRTRITLGLNYKTRSS